MIENPFRRRSALLVLALGLAGCSSLLTDPPKPLFQLTPKSTYPAGLPHLGGQLLIDVPLAPGGLDTNRIALSRSPVSLDYFADGEWTDQAPRLVQTTLLESFENSRTVTAIDRETIGLGADVVLKPELRHFEAVYDSPNGPPQVWVVLNVRLVKMPERKIIAQQSFEARYPAAANKIGDIVLAFDEALGKVMKEIVVWTISNPALQARGRTL
jgi:cholesterol transport system auxiliary component